MGARERASAAAVIAVVKTGETRAKALRKKNEEFFANFMRARSPNTYSYTSIVALIVGKNRAAGGVGFLADLTRTEEHAVKATRARRKIKSLYSLDIVPSFPKRWNAASTVHGSFSSIVRRQGQVQVAVVSFQQRLKVSNPCVDILFRAEQVLYSVSLCRGRNQLHQANGPFAGNRGCIPTGLRLDDRTDQSRIDAVAFRGFLHQGFGAVAIKTHRFVLAPQKSLFRGKVDGCCSLL